MIETFLVLCIIGVPHGFIGIPIQEYYLSRSEAQCSNYAKVERRALGFNTWREDLPQDQKELEHRCGPELRDCKDIRNWEMTK